MSGKSDAPPEFLPKSDKEGQIMVSLVKKGVTTTVYVTDGWDIDYYYTRKLDNRDMFLLLGRITSIGYVNNFSVATADSDVWVMEFKNGQLSVNWAIVRKLTVDEWNAYND